MPRAGPPFAAAAAARVVAAALAAVAVAVVPAHAAPDEARHGAADGYPVGTRTTWFRPPYLVGSFTAMEQIFPTRRVAAGNAVRELPRAPREPDWPFVQAYLDSHPASGLVVVKDGRIVIERYQYGRSATHRFTSFSMAKSVVALAFGIALGEGRIAALDDPVERYEPALAATAWQGVALRDVLTMSSGVRFDETYERADTDIAMLSRAWSQQHGALLEKLRAYTVREAPPGTRFKYVSADTQVLAQVLTRATGMPLADWVASRLWGPMGAEADAAWVLDAAGHEAGYCCLSARLRDWARLALLLLDGGARDGRQIVPRGWVHDATRAGAAHLAPRTATRYLGYGYQTWIFPGDLGFALLGVRGQAVFVHPRLKLVMVQAGVWPSASEPALGRQRDEFWRALVKAAAAL